MAAWQQTRCGEWVMEVWGVMPASWWAVGVMAIALLWMLYRRARGLWWRMRRDLTLAQRARRAVQAEHDAEGFLRRRGYRIMSTQCERSWRVYLNGEPHEVSMRADMLVSRGGKRYVAEVKSGHMAPSITTAATRRQLLEYSLAYPVDGVLLVDMHEEVLYEVAFERPGRGRPVWLAGLLGAALGATGASFLLLTR